MCLSREIRCLCFVWWSKWAARQALQHLVAFSILYCYIELTPATVTMHHPLALGQLHFKFGQHHKLSKGMQLRLPSGFTVPTVNDNNDMKIGNASLTSETTEATNPTKAGVQVAGAAEHATSAEGCVVTAQPQDQASKKSNMCEESGSAGSDAATGASAQKEKKEKQRGPRPKLTAEEKAAKKQAKADAKAKKAACKAEEKAKIKAEKAEARAKARKERNKWGSMTVGKSHKKRKREKDPAAPLRVCAYECWQRVSGCGLMAKQQQPCGIERRVHVKHLAHTSANEISMYNRCLPERPQMMYLSNLTSRRTVDRHRENRAALMAAVVPTTVIRLLIAHGRPKQAMSILS